MRTKSLLIAMLLAFGAAAQTPPADQRGTVEKAFDRLKIGGYFQLQYLRDERSRNEISNGSTRNLDEFSIRRGRVKFTFQATPNTRLIVVPDFTDSGVSLKDAYLELTESFTGRKNIVTVGQFSYPFGFENPYSSSSREVPERSRMVRTLFPGSRDRGAMLSGSALEKHLRYQLAIVNGSGIEESSDTNSRKDFVGRASWSARTVNVGASVYRGSDLVPTAANPAGREFEKHRHGLDAQWTTPLRGLTLRAEYLRGRQAPAPNSTRTESLEVDGWYLYAIQNIGKHHQLALRLDEYDRDTNTPDDAIRALTGAWTFIRDEHNKVMLGYERPRHEINDPDDDVMTLRYQYTF